MILDRLARRCYRARRLVVVLWIITLVGAHLLANVAGGDVVNNFRNPGTESQQAFDLLRARFPDEAGDRLTIVAQAPDGVEAPAVRRSMERLYGQVAALEHVTAVESPYAGRGQISADGTISVAVVQFDERGPSLPSELVPEIKRMAADADSDRLAVELGGDPVRFAEQQGPGGREGFGLAVAVIVLLALFGSLVAMSMPILTAVLGIGTAMALVSLVARFVDVPVFALPLAAMLGLGVGIDYALFIVTRFRSGLHDGPGRGACHERRCRHRRPRRVLRFADGRHLVARDVRDPAQLRLRAGARRLAHGAGDDDRRAHVPPGPPGVRWSQRRSLRPAVPPPLPSP